MTEPASVPHKRDSHRIESMLDPMTPPPKQKLGFWQRLRWVFDPHRCIGKRHDGSICRNRVPVQGQRCWECWVDLVRFGTQNQKILLAGLPDLPLPVLQRLATDESPAVRGIVAEHAPRLSVDLQVFLAGDTDNPITYRAVADREDLCDEAIRVLLRSGDVLTFGALISNPATPRWALAEITQNTYQPVADAAAERLQNMPDIDLDGLDSLDSLFDNETTESAGNNDEDEAPVNDDVPEPVNPDGDEPGSGNNDGDADEVDGSLDGQPAAAEPEDEDEARDEKGDVAVTDDLDENQPEDSDEGLSEDLGAAYSERMTRPMTLTEEDEELIRGMLSEKDPSPSADDQRGT